MTEIRIIASAYRGGLYKLVKVHFRGKVGAKFLGKNSGIIVGHSHKVPNLHT